MKYMKMPGRTRPWLTILTLYTSTIAALSCVIIPIAFLLAFFWLVDRLESLSQNKEYPGDHRACLIFAGQPHCLAFSADGRFIAAGGFNREQSGRAKDGRVRVWEVASCREVTTLDDLRAPIWALAFSPDGRFLVLGTVRSLEPRPADEVPGEVRVWETANWREIKALQGHTNRAVITATFSPDGKTLATASGDFNEPGEVILWDMASWSKKASLTEFTGRPRALAFNPAGDLLALGSGVSHTREDTGEITLWNPSDARRLGRLTGHRSRVEAVTFATDGKTLASLNRFQT